MFMLNQSGAKWTTKRKARKFGQKRHLSVGDEKGRDGWQMNLVRSKSESKNYKAILAEKQKWSWIKPFLTLCLIFSVLGILGYYFYQNYGSIIAREKLRTENMENLKARYFINAYNYNVRLGKSHLASKNYDWAVYYFELALNSQDGDEELFNNLIFACEKTCENENINCEEVNYYKNILTEFNNQ